MLDCCNGLSISLEKQRVHAKRLRDLNVLLAVIQEEGFGWLNIKARKRETIETLIWFGQTFFSGKQLQISQGIKLEQAIAPAPCVGPGIAQQGHRMLLAQAAEQGCQFVIQATVRPHDLGELVEPLHR